MDDDGPAGASLAQLLAGTNPLLEAVVDAVPEPFFVIDRHGRYLASLGGRHRARYHDGSALEGRTLHEAMPSDAADAFLETIRRALDTREVQVCQYELGADQVDGVEERDGVPTRLWFEGHVSPIDNPDGPPEAVVWMPFNITELRNALAELEQQRSELERLANTDALTGIRNRRSFLEAARHELAALSIDVEGHSFQLTTSIGLTPLVADDDITDAIVRADTALYRAKAEGRDRVAVEHPPEPCPV